MKKFLYILVNTSLAFSGINQALAVDLPPLDNFVVETQSETMPTEDKIILISIANLDKNYFIKASELGLDQNLNLNENIFKQKLLEIEQSLTAMRDAYFTYLDGQMTIVDSQDGYKIDIEKAQQDLINQIHNLSFDRIDLAVKEAKATIHRQDLEIYQDELSKKLINLEIYYGDKKWSLGPNLYAPFISATPQKTLDCDFLTGSIEIVINENPDLDKCEIKETLQIKINSEKLQNYIDLNLRVGIEKKSQGVIISQNKDGQIVFEGSAINGQKISDQQFTEMLNLALTNNINSFELPVEEIPAEVIISPELKAMGIEELVAEGYSNYSGSDYNRSYNIQYTVDKFNGHIIPAGEVFSFNDYIGPVELYNGWKMAKIIRGDKIEDGVGGGVCQFSTTLFRAALNSGISIEERYGHSIQVGYYLDKLHPNHGLDATIYIGVKDLKIKNDYDSPLLIQTYTNDKNDLYVKFYGKKDGRRVELSKPVSYNYHSTPAVYETSASLAPGEKILKDRAVTGFSVDFYRTIYKNGQVEKELFNTQYRAFPERYLIGPENPEIALQP